MKKQKASNKKLRSKKDNSLGLFLDTGKGYKKIAILDNEALANDDPKFLKELKQLSSG